MQQQFLLSTKRLIRGVTPNTGATPGPTGWTEYDDSFLEVGARMFKVIPFIFY
jgi:hypothetical protein